VSTHFEVNEGLFARSTLTDVNTACLWLGVRLSAAFRSCVCVCVVCVVCVVRVRVDVCVCVFVEACACVVRGVTDTRHTQHRPT
jgi:hypothetical protein